MFFNSKSLYFICALVVFLFAAFACSPSGNEIQLSKQDSLVLHSDFSDTIYAENSMLVFKNGNLESVVLQDEFKNKFQRIQLNSENGLFGVYNLVDHDTLDNLYYDYLEFSRKDDVDKDTKPLFFSYFFDKLSIDKKSNSAAFHFDLIKTRTKHDLICIHIIGDKELLSSYVTDENTGNFTFDYSSQKLITVVINRIHFLYENSDEIKYYHYPIIRAYSVQNNQKKSDVKRLLPMEVSIELKKKIDDFDLEEVKKRYNNQNR